MKRLFRNRLIAFVTTFLLTLSAGVNAEDTEIYFNSPNNTSAASVRPNVLLILDSSGSMTSIVSGTGRSRISLMKEAMTDILNGMEDVNVGLMRFTNKNGGPVLFPISYIDAPASSVVSETATSNISYSYPITSGDDDAEEDVSTTDVTTTDPVLNISQYLTGTGNYIQRVQSIADDAVEYYGYMYRDGYYNYVISGSPNPSGMRFTGVTVPQGATINNAYLRMWRYSSYGGSTDVYGQNVDNASSFASGPVTDITTRTPTSATVRWDFANTTPEELNVTPIIQEIVNRAGWTSGNALAMILRNGSQTMLFHSYDSNPNLAPQLEVDYTSGGSTIDQLVGLRFTNVQIPQGAKVTGATLTLTPTTNSSGAAGEQWQVKAQKASDSISFAPDPADISSRPTTTASVSWPVPDTTSGVAVTSPDLTTVVQEVVNQAGWCGGNAMTFMVSKSGASALARYFNSYEGNSSLAPSLSVSYDPTVASGCYRDTETAQISADYDDAEEDNSGNVSLNSSTLDLSSVRVGLRFLNIDVPQGATILNAFLEVNAKGSSTTNPSPTVTVNGEAVDNSPQFTSNKNNITDRSKTSAGVNWALGSFSSDGVWHTSPDLKTVVQEITDRSGWASGNAMTFLLSKDNKDRTAESHDDDPNQAARLTITYESNAGATQVKTVRQRLIEEVNNMTTDDWTPIVETLYEAAHYWRGESVVYGKSHDGLSTTRLSHPASYCNAPNDCNGANTAAYPPYGVKPKAGFTLESIQGSPTYISPFSSTLTCQSNYQVLLTDGEANSNELTSSSQIDFLSNSCATSGPKRGTFSSGEKCGYDIVKFMHDNDQSTTLDNDQTVSTYTVGYNTSGLTDATNYLKDLADAGAGQFYEATTASDLVSVFDVILSDVKSDPTSFVAPSLATNAFNRLLSRDEVYFGLFTPGFERSWDGNVKKYNLCVNSGGPDENLSTTSDNCTLGEVLDTNRVPAIGLADNKFLDTATSVWSDVVDGRATTKGGAGGEITDYTKRVIFTEQNNSGVAANGTSLALADNPGYQLDLNTWDDTGANGMDHVRNIVCPTPSTTAGSDCQTRMLWLLGKISTPNPDSDTSATTRWSFNDVLHSSPAVITYGGTDDNINGTSGEPEDTDGKISYYFDRIVVGTNDGGLRFINGNTGLEDWEFLPTEVLSQVQTEYLNPEGDHIYGMDITPTIEINDKNVNGFIEPGNGDYVHVYVGMRRGGSSIYALDVTPNATLNAVADAGKFIPPKFMWHISPSSTGFSRLAQTWSPPRLATISLSSGSTMKVLIFGGGYDPSVDNGFGTVPTGGSDNLGNAIYVVNPADGSLIFSISGSGSGANIVAPNMKYSIPTRITILDTNGDGLDDRLYFGDTGGQVWRVDLGDDIALTGSNRQGATVVGRLASVSTAGTAADERKFFDPPAVVQVKDTIYSDAASGEYDYVMIGSGNRAHPLDKTVNDRFYAFRDRFVDGMPDGNNDNLADTGTNGYPQDSGPLDTSVMVDVTTTVLDTSDATRQSQGWYYDFTTSGSNGEKVLSAPTAIAGGVFFTTYLPEASGLDPCAANIGGGRAYNLHILSAKSVVDWNENGTQEIADRVRSLGGGIPSDVVPVFTKEGVVGIVGVEGGAAQLGKLAGLPRYRTYWYQEQ